VGWLLAPGAWLTAVEEVAASVGVSAGFVPRGGWWVAGRAAAHAAADDRGRGRQRHINAAKAKTEPIGRAEAASQLNRAPHGERGGRIGEQYDGMN